MKKWVVSGKDYLSLFDDDIFNEKSFKEYILNQYRPATT
jgi:hypothetical protein